MAGRRSEPDQAKPVVVTSRFAYVTAKSGEVRQHVLDDVLDPELYDPKSLEHLRSIGFVADQD